MYPECKIAYIVASLLTEGGAKLEIDTRSVEIDTPARSRYNNVSSIDYGSTFARVAAAERRGRDQHLARCCDEPATGESGTRRDYLASRKTSTSEKIKLTTLQT